MSIVFNKMYNEEKIHFHELNHESNEIINEFSKISLGISSKIYLKQLVSIKTQFITMIDS